MRIQPFRAVYPNLDHVISPDTFFGRVKYEYPQYKEEGFFKKTSQNSIYIYRIEKPHRQYTGLIACSDVREYLAGNIKKHEKTLSAKEEQQMQLMVRRNAIVKPVLLIYPQVSEIDKLIEKTILEHAVFYQITFPAEDQTHTFWQISEQEIIQRFEQLFLEKIPVTYIADGHHRAATSALMHTRLDNAKDGFFYNLMLSAFFPASELEIYDFNRIVDCLSNQSMTTFMAKLSQVFEIEILDGPQKPLKKFEITMFINQEWFKLFWKASVIDKYTSQSVILDAELLDKEVFIKRVGIEDIRSDVRINYVEGTKGLDAIISKTIKNDRLVAFCLYPVEVMELTTVADEGKTMPPKSTFFEPRIKNGLIVQEFK